MKTPTIEKSQCLVLEKIFDDFINQYDVDETVMFNIKLKLFLYLVVKLQLLAQELDGELFFEFDYENNFGKAVLLLNNTKVVINKKLNFPCDLFEMETVDEYVFLTYVVKYIFEKENL